MSAQATRVQVMLFGPKESGKSSILDTLFNAMVFREKEYFSSAGVLGIQTSFTMSDSEVGQEQEQQEQQQPQLVSLVEVAGSYFNLKQQLLYPQVKRQIERSQYIVLTFNRCDGQQFVDIKTFIEKYYHDEVFSNKLVYLVGTFSDRPADLIEVTEAESRQLAREYGIQYISISSKDRSTLFALFGSIIQSERKRIEEGGFHEIKQYLIDIQKKYMIDRIAVYQFNVLQKIYAKHPIRNEIFHYIVNLISPCKSYREFDALNAKRSLYPFIFTSV